MTGPRLLPPVRVVGMTFRRAYPDNILDLAKEVNDDQMADILGASGWDSVHPTEPTGPAVTLRRDPRNPHDANAIEVHIQKWGLRGFVGFIPKELAAEWAPMFDRPGFAYEAWVSAVPVDPKHLDKPGLEITVRVTQGA